MSSFFLAAAAVVALLLVVWVLRPLIGLEQPNYTLVSRDGALDIRDYAPLTVASTQLTGRYEQSSSRGFRVIAGYIFGGNQQSERLAMTAPVLVGNPSAPSYPMAFVMPSAAVRRGLPTPSSDALSLQEQRWGRVAVWSFGGWVSEARVAEAWQQMRQALAAKGLQAERFDWIAQYSPPTLPPPFRRNELWVMLDATPES